MKQIILILLVCTLACMQCVCAQNKRKNESEQKKTVAPSPVRMSLNGECAFAADYAEVGEKFSWFSPDLNDDVWDRLKIPHVWSMDPRYPYYAGTAWYRKLFTVPGELRDRHIRLVFEAVYANATIWLNGKQIISHQGGYTPFEADVTALLKFDSPNLLAVKADNRFEKRPNAIPQLVRAWMEDGGIIRDVYLSAHAGVYITNQKIEAEPDLRTGEAIIRITTWVRNTGNEPVAIRLQGAISKEKEPLNMVIPAIRVDAGANSIIPVKWMVKLSGEMVSLWGLDNPVLYHLTTSLEGVETADPVTFGIRRFEVKGTELVLNGFPVKLAGGNRVASGTAFGQDDPAEWVEKDLRLMKEAGLELMRMHHVPLSRAVLDWADRNGLLLIEECETPGDLVSEEATKLDRSKMKEMIERDWNRPSIVAWSIGNEYDSETPEGVKWSKEKKAYVLTLDSTRLICFASNRAAKPVLNPEEEASSLMDILCLNTYGTTPADNAVNIDRAHQRWPGKPMIITEFGWRADRVGQELDRELWFKEMIDIFRERPFLSGASVWSFNDYRSRYVNTNPDGYRWWGLIDANRNTRGSYSLFKRECTPIVLKEACMRGKNISVKLAGRTGFPLYPPTGCKVRIQFYNFRGREIDVQENSVTPLAPGEHRELLFPMKDGVTYFRGEIFRGNFSMLIFGPTTWTKK